MTDTTPRELLRDRVKLLRGFAAARDRVPDYWRSGIPVVYSAMRYGMGLQQNVSFSQERTGKVSYARRVDDATDNARRVRTTFARYVRRQLLFSECTISDQNLQILASCVMGHCLCGDGFVDIVSGQDITSAYADGFGGSSCMTGDCSRYIQLYAMNPDKVSLVKYSNGTTARALLWHCDDGTTYLDRIYPTDNGPHIESMQHWAERRGYIHRAMDWNTRRELRVTLDRTADYWPYCDTFTTCDDMNSGVMLLADDSGEYRLDSTCGERGEDGYSCESCGCRVDNDDMYSSENGGCYCLECYHDIFCTCEYCEQETRNDDAVRVDDSEYWCQYCADTHAVQCEDCGDYNTEDYHVTEDTSRAYCTGCIDRNAQQCEECGEYHETTETIYGEEYCETCAADKRADAETSMPV